MDTTFKIERQVFTEKSFRKHYGYEKLIKTTPKQKILELFQFKGSTVNAIKNWIFGVVPILQWLPRYKVKKWLLADFACGLTVGVMHISQGMSYSLLAGQHPIYGLYSSFFPVILYTVLGTSRHTAIGSFGLTSLMLGNAMMALAPAPVVNISNDVTGSVLSEEEAWAAVYQRRILLGTGCMFITGIFLITLSVFRVGSIVIYLSDVTISGFIFAASVHIVIYQINILLGLTIESYAGPLNLIWILRDVCLGLANLDAEEKNRVVATSILSAVCLIFLATLKTLNEKFKDKIPYNLPLPGELIVVVGGTVVSYCANLFERYGVSIVGDIPSGLPAPSLPPFNEMPSLIKYAIPMAIMGYSVSISMAKIFGNKFGYEINPNQELVAYGVSNTVSSFFLCFPAFPAMSRSCVQAESGGKTQVVGFVASGVVLLVLLVLGKYLGTLPKACLASIVCVALRGMLMKILDLRDLWKTSKLDCATWLVSAFATLFIGVVYGLLVGIVFSLLCVVFRTQLVGKDILDQIGDTEMYRKSNQYRTTKLLDGICVCAFRGPLHYLNKEAFRSMAIKSTGIDPLLEFAKTRKSNFEIKQKTENVGNKVSCDESGSFQKNAGESKHMLQIEESGNEINLQKTSLSKLQYLILDCAQISFMDSVGVKTLRSLTEDYLKIGVKVLLGNCSGEIFRMLSISGYIHKFSNDIIFVSVHDAITFVLYEIKQAKLHSQQDQGSNESIASIDESIQ